MLTKDIVSFEQLGPGSQSFKTAERLSGILSAHKEHFDQGSAQFAIQLAHS